MKILLNALFSLSLIAGNGAAASGLPKAVIALGGSQFEVELALDDASRMRGLMFRESMSDDRGMLFVFDREEPQAFWMRNTRIALDIIYFDARSNVVSISDDTPPCRTATCSSYPSEGPAQFVVELNAGMAARLKLRKGSPLCLIGQGRFGLPGCAEAGSD